MKYTGIGSRKRGRLSLFASTIMLFFPFAVTGVAAMHSPDSETRGPALRVSVTPANSQYPIQLYKGSYALLIGNSQYGKQSGFSTLHSVPQELNEIERVLKLHNFTITRVEEKNKREIKAAVNQFIERHGHDEQNRLLIYYSGHGDTVNDRGYLIPREGISWYQAKKTGQEIAFRRNAIKMETVKSWTREIDSKHLLMLFDSCFSGTIFNTKSSSQAEPRHISKSVQRPVREYITAGDAGEKVPARSDFAISLVHALEDGKADLYRDGYITGTELGLFLHSEVSRNGIQTPQHGKDNEPYYRGGDFVFVLRGASEQQQWKERLESMRNAYLQVIQLSQSKITPAEKIEQWRSFLLQSEHQLNKPYSREDEQFRESAENMVVYWTRHAESLAAEEQSRKEREKARQAQKRREREAPRSQQEEALRVKKLQQEKLREAQEARQKRQLQLAQQEREQWRSTMDQMGREYWSLDAYDKSDVTIDSKIHEWNNFLTHQQYSRNNPHTREDERLRGLAEERLAYWEEKKRNPLPPRVPKGFKMVAFDSKGEKELCYTIGSPKGEKDRSIREQQKDVCIKPFRIASHEVTNAMVRAWDRDHSSGEYRGESFDGDQQPVARINWNRAEEYIEWLNRTLKPAKPYRLPTEAEWEYAAQGGKKSSRYWGEDDELTEACGYANVLNPTVKKEFDVGWDSFECEDGYKVTAPVGRFIATKDGLYDILGNVWEWTSSEYASQYDGSELKRSDAGRDSGQRAVRGGSWFSIPGGVRAASRLIRSPDTRYSSIGFRLAQDL
jgi:formylglycine-generating enzyme required for sulfatase activity